MVKHQLQTTSSITWRLRVVMTSIAIFFILSAVGIYISSIGFFEGLQKINSANQILNYTNVSIEAIETSETNLDRLQTHSSARDVKFAFDENQKILKNSVNKAIKEARTDREIKSILQKSLDSIYLYEDSVNHLFNAYSKDPRREVLNSELLIADQYALDAKEFLRKVQIQTREESDALFTSIYTNRFRPLLVAVTLSGFFFLFVITFGFSTARKISISVQNLKGAANKVQEGDLNFEAPVTDRDEFGMLTETFNEMVQTLNLSLNRIQTLQKITASFSEALTADQVIDVTIKEGLKALNADTGSVAIPVNDGNDIEVIRFTGFVNETQENWSRFPSKISTPASDCMRAHKAIYIEERKELLERYPHLEKEISMNNLCSVVSVPLMIGENCLGSINLHFKEEKRFSEEERKFMLAIAGQCSQALYRSKLYDDARKAIQVRDEFLSIASHELKTPLTPLKLQLQLMSRNLKMNPESMTEERMDKMMTNADKQMNRLSKLIEDLLDVSRITSGKLKLNLEYVNLQDVVRDVLVQYGHQLQAHLAHVEIEADQAVHTLVDPLRIEQVLVNLLTNAVKYAPMKTIKVTLTRSGQTAKICVKDEGPGIAPEHQERIFGRFERVRATDNIGGLGLGLYISRQIVEAHHGKIFVESTPGKGSNFVIELPITQNV